MDDISPVKPPGSGRTGPHPHGVAKRILLALRGWLRAAEPGLVVLALFAGVCGGLLAAGMRAATLWLHELFGHGVVEGAPGAIANPLTLVLLPALGGLLLGLFNMLRARYHAHRPVDPIEANALHGGRMAPADSLVVAVQNILSNGFGASVGLEAGYAQVGSGAASRLGVLFGLRRGDLRVLVGCGAGGAIAAAFDAPLTGAFYAFELIIGTYTIAALAPVVMAAVAGSLVARALHGQTYFVQPGEVIAPGWEGYPMALVLGVACALVGIVLMRSVGTVETVLKKVVPWAALRPAVGGLCVGGLALIMPGVLGAGHGGLHLAFDMQTAIGTVALLFALKTAASAISLGAGFRGGLFFASLMMGALFGSLFAAALPLVGLPPQDRLLLTLIGMSAFGTAVVGAPLTMTFLAMESTGNFAVAGVVLTAAAVTGVLVRRLFGYSFATWRFHLRGEAIRSALDIGWLFDLTVERLMRRDVASVRADMPLAAFRAEFPLGATERVVVCDASGRYAGMMMVAEAHAAAGDTPLDALLHLEDALLLPRMNVKEAMAVFDTTEAEALAVVDALDSRKVVGLVTASHLLRRYGEELDRRRQEEVGAS